MNTTRFKLMMAVVMMTLSVVMLVGASLAWFTLSTAPEISGIQVSLYTDIDLLVSKTNEDANFAQSASTDFTRSKPVKDDTSIDNLPFYAPLKPISTADGVNWFKPAYKADGFLEDVSKFPLATDENVNVMVWNQDENGIYKKMDELSNEYYDALDAGYYVYADIWLKTENKEGVAVTLSVPNIGDNDPHSKGNLQSWELGDESDYSEAHGKKYGTWVLERHDEEGAAIGNFAQTVLRIGFEADGKFTIYEPNADQRSLPDLKPREGDREPNYVVGYNIQQSGEILTNYQSGCYIPTYPIWATVDEAGKIIGTIGIKVPADRLMVQRTSAWRKATPENKLINPTSADVAVFGKFISSTAVLYDQISADTGMAAITDGANQDLASSTIITTLKPDEAKKVRIYFWLEGQDVDCWNDIANGSITVNLEFAAQPLPPQADPPQDPPETPTGDSTAGN